ncbi:hypothetical protein COO60DRAFT_829477 [Scenedesmus sp. NREL 46B-D3]|nr:hypothetical protein COO60DRAFT_829477 [Scenedesmus sp. NREL 46B-D3]
MNTPTKKASPGKQPRTPPRSPGPCPYKGIKVQVPGEIFEQQESSSAEVKGWNNRRTDQLVVKFDDGTRYWFPLADVLAWMGEALPPASQLTGSSPAAADTTSTPRRVTRHAAAAAAAAESSDRQQQRVEQGNEQQAGRAYASAAAAATAAEVSDVSLWQQQQSQSLSRRQRMQRLQRAAGSDKTRNEALLAAGLLVALLVMVAAVWLARRPVHELGPGYDAPADV